MRGLQKEQVIRLHEQMVEATGGSHGIREDHMLESALAAPFQTFAGTPAYPSLQKQAARLCYGLVQNHPFIDGNKRTGAHVMLVFLALNGFELTYTQAELADLILSVASGESDHETILKWLLDHEN